MRNIKLIAAVTAASLAPLGALTLLTLRNNARYSVPPKIEAITGSVLEKKVTQLVQIFSSSRVLAASDHVSVVCYNTQTKKLVCSINPDQQMQLASVVKVFIAAAYLQKNSIDPVNYPLDDSKINRLRLMLADSQNEQANYFFDYLGGPAEVQKTMETLGIKSNIVEKISTFNGSTYKNTATAENICALYELILENKLPNSELLKTILRSSNRTRLFSGLPNGSYGNKTGTTDHAFNDTGFFKDLIIITMMTGDFNDNKVSLTKLQNRIGKTLTESQSD